MEVAPGRIIDSFLSIPDAESLPLCRMVLKLACVCTSFIQASSTVRGRFAYHFCKHGWMTSELPSLCSDP